MCVCVCVCVGVCVCVCVRDRRFYMWKNYHLKDKLSRERKFFLNMR